MVLPGPGPKAKEVRLSEFFAHARFHVDASIFACRDLLNPGMASHWKKNRSDLVARFRKMAIPCLDSAIARRSTCPILRRYTVMGARAAKLALEDAGVNGQFCDRAERQSILNEIRVKTPEAWKEYSRAIERSMKEFARTGFCILNEHRYKGVRAVAVPLKRPFDGERIVFNCVANVDHLGKGTLENQIGPRLVAFVRAIEASLKTF